MEESNHANPHDIWIRYTAPINAESVDALLGLLENEAQCGRGSVHLLLSSPGGSVSQGLLAFNYIRSLPVTLKTYNVGAVDSICAVLYCAGTRRFCAPHARFLLHPVATACDGHLEKPQLLQKLAEVEADTEIIASLLASASETASPAAFVTAMSSATVLQASAAVAMGLAHQVALPPLVKGVRFASVPRSPRPTIVSSMLRASDLAVGEEPLGEAAGNRRA